MDPAFRVRFKSLGCSIIGYNSPMPDSRDKRRWYQFSLRGFFLSAMLVVWACWAYSLWQNARINAQAQQFMGYELWWLHNTRHTIPRPHLDCTPVSNLSLPDGWSFKWIDEKDTAPGAIGSESRFLATYVAREICLQCHSSFTENKMVGGIVKRE